MTVKVTMTHDDVVEACAEWLRERDVQLDDEDKKRIEFVVKGTNPDGTLATVNATFEAETDHYVSGPYR